MSRPIDTELGKLQGRDAIYLDQLLQIGQRLELLGEINGQLCAPPHKKNAWFKFRLTFTGVGEYDGRDVDVCTWQRQSSFDELEGLDAASQSLDRTKRCFVVSTYDWVYKVAAERFQLELLGERPQS